MSFNHDHGRSTNPNYVFITVATTKKGPLTLKKGIKPRPYTFPNPSQIVVVPKPNQTLIIALFGMVLKGTDRLPVILSVGASDQKTLICVSLEGMDKQYNLSLNLEDMLKSYPHTQTHMHREMGLNRVIKWLTDRSVVCSTLQVQIRPACLSCTCDPVFLSVLCLPVNSGPQFSELIVSSYVI